MNRVKTGVRGLDALIEGGFPENRTIIVSGGTGTGKTIFSTQYLVEGARQYNEPGVLVTLDERPDLIREDVSRFGWDLGELERKKMLSIIDGSIAKVGLPSDEEFSLPVTGFDLDKLLLEIMRAVKQVRAKRVVVDSIPGLGFNFENQPEARKAVLKLSYILQRAGVTAILTTEIQEGSNRFGKYGVEEYIADGVILLHYLGVGTKSNRTLHIRKMRATKHSEELHPIEFSKTGIVVHKIDEEYNI